MIPSFEVHYGKMKMKLNENSRLIILIGMLLGVPILASPASERVATREEIEKAVFVLDGMYERYLVGHLEEARSNLVSAVTFIHEQSSYMPTLQRSLPIGYARLSLLERKAGNEAQSRIYFEKSRYWRIFEQERLKMKPEQIIGKFDSFSRDDSDQYALEWDKKHTKGAGPAYLKDLK
jgi:hypothetical protein